MHNTCIVGVPLRIFSFRQFLTPAKVLVLFGGGFVLEKIGKREKFLSVLAQRVQPTDGNGKNVEFAIHRFH